MEMKKLSSEIAEQQNLVGLKECDSLDRAIFERPGGSGNEDHLETVHRVQ